MQGAKIIKLPKILDDRGNLSLFQNQTHIPFDIKRTYWIYDVPGGAIRGSHAFINSCEFIVALSGSFTVVLHDGAIESTYHLNRSYYGLYVPNKLWRHMENFATNSVALIVSNTLFDETDYVRDKQEFLKFRRDAKNGI
ncbi:MAG: FdtA/QdtA family cupin domain-containing protein [Bacteroidota bacterium]